MWYQLVGTDNHPMPIAKEGAVVYANGALDCAGNAKEGGTVTYSNTEGSTRDDHQFADGFCTVCQQLDESYMAAVDGYYEEITNCYNAGYVIGMDGTNSLWRNGSGKGTNNFDTYGYQGTSISEDEYDLSCGSVAYQINGNKSENVAWFQKLGEDAHPVPFASHGIVYAVGDLYCDGTSKGGDISFSHLFREECISSDFQASLVHNVRSFVSFEHKRY